jgi:tryptophan synthase alpha chain
MSRIEEALAACRAEKRAAFIPYLTAGDPDLETTESLLPALVRGGADLIELGVPFSDPIADGPVNQRAATRALESGTTLTGILKMVAHRREELAVPVILFTYFNPILAHGVERFAEHAATSGVDGVLCVDLPPEEAEDLYLPALREAGVDPLFLLSPTSHRKRVKLVDRASSGFVYYVSRTGVTGEGELPDDLARRLKKLRRKLDHRLVVGFGINTPQQVAALGAVSDGVVVGSALVRLVEEHAGDKRLPGLLQQEVRRHSTALRPGGNGRSKWARGSSRWRRRSTAAYWCARPPAGAPRAP